MEIKEAEQAIEKFYEIRDKYKQAKDESTKINSELQYAYSEFAQKLEDAGITSYKGSKGTFSFRYEEGVRVPKTIEEKQTFFNYVLDKYGEEYAWNLISFNSRTLNSFYKEEEKESDDLEFKIPGLEKSEPVIRFSLRKQGEK